MSILTRLYPTGAGYIDGATPNGATYNWQCNDDLYGSEDDDTTYSRYSSGARCAFVTTVPSMWFSMSGDVTVEGRIREEVGAETGALFVRLNATNQDGTTFGITSSYGNYSRSHARVGGGTWTIADLRSTGANGFQFGYVWASGYQFHRTTRVNIRVNLSAVPATVVHNVASVLGPIWGAALTWAEWCKMRAMLRSRLILTDEEAVEWWRELRDISKRPKRYFDLRGLCPA